MVVGRGVTDVVDASDAVGLADAVAVGEAVVPEVEGTTTAQVPTGITQLEGVGVPPRGEPRNPKVVEAPGASDVLQRGPVNRNPPTVAVLVASQTEVMAFP